MAEADATTTRSAASSLLLTVSMARLEHAGAVPALRRDEADATLARTLDTVVIPGYLQTADYAAEI